MPMLFQIIKKIQNIGFAYVFLGQVMTKFVAFFGSVFVIHLLTKEEFGLVGYFENLYGYAYILAGLGMANAIIRYVVLEDTKQGKYNFFLWSIKWAFLIDLILVIILGIIGSLYHHPGIFNNYSFLLLFCLINLPFQDICNCCLSNERAMLANRRYAFISFCLTLGVILARVIGALLYGMLGMFVFQTLVYAFLAFLFFSSSKQYHFTKLTREDISQSRKKEAAKYSLQYMVTNGLWAIFMLNEIYMLGFFGLGPESLAEYKVAYVFPGNMSIITLALGIVVAPYFIKNEDNHEWVVFNMVKTVIASCILMGVCSVMVAFLGEYLIGWLYGNRYIGTVGLMKLMLLPTFFGAAIRFPIANILAAVGKIKYNMFAAIVGIVVQVLGCYVLIPLKGTGGAVMGTFLSMLVMSCFLVFAVIKEYDVLEMILVRAKK